MVIHPEEGNHPQHPGSQKPETTKGVPRLPWVLLMWTPGFAELAKPLHDATRGSDGTFTWSNSQDQAFLSIQKALLEALALALPDLSKLLQLYTDEKLRVTKGVLTQQLGPWKCQLHAYQRN